MLDYRKPYILVTKGMSGQITQYDLEAWEGKGRGLPSIAIGASCGMVDDKYHDKRKTYLIYYDIVYTKVFALDVAARHRVQFSMPESDAVTMLKNRHA